MIPSGSFVHNPIRESSHLRELRELRVKLIAARFNTNQCLLDSTIKLLLFL